MLVPELGGSVPELVPGPFRWKGVYDGEVGLGSLHSSLSHLTPCYSLNFTSVSDEISYQFDLVTLLSLTRHPDLVPFRPCLCVRPVPGVVAAGQRYERGCNSSAFYRVTTPVRWWEQTDSTCSSRKCSRPAGILYCCGWGYHRGIYAVGRFIQIRAWWDRAMAQAACKNDGKLEFAKDFECFFVAFGRLLQDAPLWLAEPFSPYCRCLFLGTWYFFLFHRPYLNYCIQVLAGSGH